MGEAPLERLFWWKEKSPPSPLRMAAQVMAFGNLDDIQTVRKLHGDRIFGEVLKNPPRGLFDPKTWVFWHKKLKITPIPPFPSQYVVWPR